MSISISDIINVSIAVSPNAVATDGFGPMLFMSKQFQPQPLEAPVRTYSSNTEVLNDFPTGEIANAAAAWYGQKPTPKTFLVGAITHDTIVAAKAATMTGGTAAILADLKAINTGALSFSISGTQYSLSNVDLSSAADLGAVVTALTTALNNANVPATISQNSGVFKLTSKATGATVAFDSSATGNLAAPMKLDSASNPVRVAGEDAQSIASDLTNAVNSNLNFFYVGIDSELRGTDTQFEAAKWCQGADKVFGWGDSDPNILKLGTTNSFKKAKDNQLRNTICVFDASENGDQFPEVSILARAATVNFNVANSVLILAFKQGPGITVADISSNQLAALRSYNGNAFIKVGDNALFLDGKMADGTWFDTVQGVSWLTQKIRNNVFNLFYTSTTKIPWTDTGVAMVNQQVTLALELGVTNGLIAPGYDNEGNFYPDGYKVMSTDLSLLQSQKGDRIWEGTSFIAIGSGALQGATITGNFVQ